MPVVVDANWRSRWSIYAIGDVNDRLALTLVAIREGDAVVESLFGKKPWTSMIRAADRGVSSRGRRGRPFRRGGVVKGSISIIHVVRLLRVMLAADQRADEDGGGAKSDRVPASTSSARRRRNDPMVAVAAKMGAARPTSTRPSR